MPRLLMKFFDGIRARRRPRKECRADGLAPIRFAARQWLLEWSKLPPRKTRSGPLVSNRFSHHSAALPCMSQSPSTLGGYEPYLGRPLQAGGEEVGLLLGHRRARLVKIKTERALGLIRHGSAAAGVFPLLLRRQAISPAVFRAVIFELRIYQLDEFPGLLPCDVLHREAFQFFIANVLNCPYLRRCGRNGSGSCPYP